MVLLPRYSQTCNVGCAFKGNLYIVTVFKIVVIYFSISRSGEGEEECSPELFSSGENLLPRNPQSWNVKMQPKVICIW